MLMVAARSQRHGIYRGWIKDLVYMLKHQLPVSVLTVPLWVDGRNQSGLAQREKRLEAVQVKISSV